jgi:excinuclease ABC subunit C
MVVLQDGQPQPSAYRHFRVRGDPSASGDDFGALYQVLARRLRRARQGEPRWALPQLIVVDGGKGQLSVAQAALRDAGFDPEQQLPDLAALAKERPDAPLTDEGRSRRRAEWDRPDRVFLPGQKDPLRLRPNTVELFLLSRIRDEAHRFAITHHKKLRRKEALRSDLERVPGIGPQRRRQLLRTLGSLKRVREANVEELAAVPGMTRRAAEAVARYFTTKRD